MQGSATFPDIPSGLPIILLASAGTAVLATGITSAKGNKGAGAPNPNFSDFITTGGVVAADRLQFSLWTIVGIATFLMLVFLSDPSKIDNLPAIPNGFLELMGISAGAYIGGKLARKPGPTLQSVVISSGEPEKAESGKTGKHEPKLLTFELTGAGLSQSAEFNIDGKPIYPDTIQADDKSNLPKVIQVDPTINDPSFARMLRFTCTQPREEWLGKPHTFTIINPDKQKSSLEYEKFKIDNVELSGKKLTITGACLDANLTVEYPDAEGKTQRVDNAKLSGNTNYTADLNELSKGDSVAVTIKDAQGLQVVWNVLTVAAPMVGEPVQVGINPPVSEGISQRQPAHSVARRQPEQAGPPVQPAQEAAKEDVVAQGNGHK